MLFAFPLPPLNASDITCKLRRCDRKRDLDLLKAFCFVVKDEKGLLQNPNDSENQFPYEMR